MPVTAAFRGWKAQDAIEWFHGIGRLARAFPKFESYGMLETAASVGWKVKDAIVWFHGIGRLALSDCVASNGEVLKWDCLD